MSRILSPSVVVGNDLMLPQSTISVPAPVVLPQPSFETPTETIPPIDLDITDETPTKASLPRRFLELLHRYSLGAFALLFLLVGSSAVQVMAAYSSAHISLATTAAHPVVHVPSLPLHGPNAIVAQDQLAATLQHITSQSLTLTTDTKTVSISPDMIRSWLQVAPDSKHGVAYIHVKDAGIGAALNQAADPFVKTAVNQVTATHPDGTSQVIVAGHDGTQLGDTSALAKQVGQNLLGAKGMQLNLPLQTVPFQAVTPAAFDKLLEVDVNSKQMWAYDKGQLTRTFLVSAGAPATPTPLGQYKIYEKLPVQDMKGFNADGSKYLQPHVHWVNYFLPGGYAVHGNYWRPLSWFGAINSSHGCVSVPDDEAEWVYDWAPIGTTVITHA